MNFKYFLSFGDDVICFVSMQILASAARLRLTYNTQVMWLACLDTDFHKNSKRIAMSSLTDIYAELQNDT